MIGNDNLLKFSGGEENKVINICLGEAIAVWKKCLSSYTTGIND